MGLIFRKRVKILPGLTVNLGKRGTSVTVGKRGASVNFSSRGAHANVGIPGTGISYRTRLDKPASNNRRVNSKSTATARFMGGQGTSGYNANNMTEEQASISMWLINAVAFIVAIVFFCISGNNAYSSPGTVIFSYSVGAIALAVGATFTGFSINVAKKVESKLPISLMSISLVLTGLAFFIWTFFWPDSAYYYREVWVSKVRETVNLGGWVTFGRIMSAISIILGIILFVANKNDSK